MNRKSDRFWSKTGWNCLIILAYMLTVHRCVWTNIIASVLTAVLFVSLATGESPDVGFGDWKTNQTAKAARWCSRKEVKSLEKEDCYSKQHILSNRARYKTMFSVWDQNCAFFPPSDNFSLTNTLEAQFTIFEMLTWQLNGMQRD